MTDPLASASEEVSLNEIQPIVPCPIDTGMAGKIRRQSYKGLEAIFFTFGLTDHLPVAIEATPLSVNIWVAPVEGAKLPFEADPFHVVSH